MSSDVWTETVDGDYILLRWPDTTVVDEICYQWGRYRQKHQAPGLDKQPIWRLCDLGLMAGHIDPEDVLRIFHR